MVNNVVLFTEFLDLVKVLKMLYGRQVAEIFFTKNVGSYYDLDSESLSQIVKEKS